MKKRESNFELLRIVLMLLIIVGHLLLNSEKLGAIGTKEYYITNIYTFHQDIWKKPDPWKNKCLLRSKFLQSELV